MPPKKPNPNKRPCTEADVKRAKREATDDALRLSLYITLYVLLDKFGFSEEQLARASQYINRTAQELADGQIKWQDIMTVLKDEYNVELSLK